MPDLFWTIGIALANEQAMLPIGVAYGFLEGFYRKQWKPILGLVLLLVASVFIGEGLKSLFKVPLIFDPTRYGFPSGHTQFSTVFYGWICYQLSVHAPRFLRIIYSVLTMLILAYAVTSIVHYGYHTWFDIMGGFISGSVILFLGTRFTLLHPTP